MSSGYMKPAALAAIAVIIGALANIGLIGIFENHQMAAWIATLIATIVLTACIGKAINDRWDGVIVSGRNMISLSKLQMLAWTILILSALITAAAHNIHIGDPAHALDIDIDQQLLIVMGIATTSLVASPAVLSLTGGSDGQPAVATNVEPAGASWLDLFRSDMADTAAAPDLSKIQQFLVTLVVLSTYAVLIGKTFASFPPVKTCAVGQCLFLAFPPIGEKLVWLIGISHAGYIAYKAVPKPSAAGEAAIAPPPPPANSAPDDGAVG